jgi:catechol 2,3-dioxygenase-like lactoylglutathione lyase family enzyme
MVRAADRREGDFSVREEAAVAPILPSRDLDGTAAFYAPLGFSVAARYPEPEAYLILRRGGIELHFVVVPDLDPATSCAGAYVRLQHVDPLYEEFARVLHGAPPQPRLLSPEDKSWGMREFALIDPDGTLLRFGAHIG